MSNPPSPQHLEYDDGNPLSQPIRYVKNVGQANPALLARLGIQTVEDLLWYLPRDVLDLTEVRPVSALKKDELQTVRGVVVDLDARPLKGGRTLTAVLLDCGEGYVRGVWFNQPWMLRKFQLDQTVLFSGKPKRHAGRWEMSHPQIQWIEEDDFETTGGLLPRYGLTEGLKMYQLRRLTRQVADEFASLISDPFPAAFREHCKLPPLATAIRNLHIPPDLASYEQARQRVIFSDLLDFQLGLALKRRAWRKGTSAPALQVTPKIDARIRRLFPFRFTEGQDRAVEEIAVDLGSTQPMHRLLQADVGAGKTAIAIYAMLASIAAGYQAVLMAPTEVLALQHWDTINEALLHSRVERLLLTGQLTAKGRKESLQAIREGDAQLIVGTQAIIQHDVAFHQLGVVVIDEQHKFGVMQRAHFASGGLTPHMLVMTATPIPRSLCLTQFGDLDLSLVTEMPPNRQPVTTSLIGDPATEQKAWEFVRKQLQAGRQCYIVCPRIEANAERTEADQTHSAEAIFSRLSQGELADFRVALIHGRMDREQRQRVMDDFREGRLQALVATTVIEVGVHVPNATMMVVFQAERFGLSQLHQLRGRVGRGALRGYCFLISDPQSTEANERLQAMVKTANGFEIAEADFALRGPGDVLGTRQHGQLPLRVADLRRDHKALLRARKTAFELVESGRFDQPEFAPLKIQVLDRFRELMDLKQTG